MTNITRLSDYALKKRSLRKLKGAIQIPTCGRCGGYSSGGKAHNYNCTNQSE